MRLDIETLKKVENEFGTFDVSQILGGSNDVYLRFGYWKKVDVDKLQEILGTSIIIKEDTDYDGDCGNQYIYRLFDSMFNIK